MCRYLNNFHPNPLQNSCPDLPRSSNVLKMFSLQSTDELVFGPSNFSVVSQSDDHIIEDLIQDHAFIQSNVIDFTATTGNNEPQQRQMEPPTKIRDVYGHKKELHRDIERKRRQEMSDLYSSLRSLLPVEIVKGKRSICDHMHEAENYIKELKKGIQEMEIRRDKLKRKVSEPSVDSENGNSNDGNSLVVVNLVGNMVEILISCSSDSVRLSKVVAELVDNEINVVTCVSTKTKGRFLHKVLAEVSDGDLQTLDPLLLQQKLSRITNPSSNSCGNF